MSTGTISGGYLVSVGYQGRSLKDLLSVLDEEGVDVLVDVREDPRSRKPGLSRSGLELALSSTGITYIHEPLLGNPRANRESFRSGDRAARRRFVSRLENGSRAALEDVVALAHAHVVALLCFERAHEECHRSAIIEVAQAEQPHLRVVTL